VRAKWPPCEGTPDWLIAAKNADRICELYDRTLDELDRRVDRYVAYVEAGGRSGPQYVNTPQTWFAVKPDGPWSRQWTPPKSKAQQQQDANIDASLQWLREQEAKDAANGSR